MPEGYYALGAGMLPLEKRNVRALEELGIYESPEDTEDKPTEYAETVLRALLKAEREGFVAERPPRRSPRRPLHQEGGEGGDGAAGPSSRSSRNVRQRTLLEAMEAGMDDAEAAEGGDVE